MAYKIVWKWAHQTYGPHSHGEESKTLPEAQKALADEVASTIDDYLLSGQGYVTPPVVRGVLLARARAAQVGERIGTADEDGDVLEHWIEEVGP